MTRDEIDARRYRWLKANAGEIGWNGEDGNWHGFEDLRYSPCEAPALDAAIDAAMADDDTRYELTDKGRELLGGGE